MLFSLWLDLGPFAASSPMLSGEMTFQDCTLNQIIQSSVKWTHTQCMYVHSASGKLAKSMFVIHTHRQLIMIIHWSWSEYGLLRSPGSGLTCISQHLNVSLCKTLCAENPDRAHHYQVSPGFWTKSCSWALCRFLKWWAHLIQDLISRERQRL